MEVNETTLELGCVKTRRLPTQLNTRFTEILEINGCKKGSKKEDRICEKKNVVRQLSLKKLTVSPYCPNSSNSGSHLSCVGKTRLSTRFRMKRNAYVTVNLDSSTIQRQKCVIKHIYVVLVTKDKYSYWKTKRVSVSKVHAKAPMSSY